MTEPNWSAAAREADAVAATWSSDGPGGVVLLFDRDGIRHEAAAGLASLSHGLPFTAATPTRFASLTKHVFSAFALLRGLDLDAPLGSFLPELPAAIAAVPVRRALTMTSGIPDLMQSYTLCGLPHSAIVDLDALDAFALTMPGLDTEPGTELSYSNTGYRLAERALAASGGDVDAWVEGPLNAALGTGLRFPRGWDRVVPGLADGYWRETPDAPWRTGFYGPGLSASGALTGSARDLAAWLTALLRGDGPAGDVLPRLATSATLKDGRATGYGLGLAFHTLGGHDLVGHGGSLVGFKNQFLLHRETGTGAVVFSNREDAETLNLALAVMAALLGEPLPLPAPVPDLLPQGLFVEAQGPAWAEHRDGALTFLGAREMLYAGASPGEAVSRSPYVPMRLHAEDGAIVGEIGHARRRFLPVAPDAALAPELAGTWRCEAQNAALSIEIGADGTGHAAFGLGPLHRCLPLVPLDGTRALMTVGAMPWPLRTSLWLRAPDTLRLTAIRSRVLDFRRMA